MDKPPKIRFPSSLDPLSRGKGFTKEKDEAYAEMIWILNIGLIIAIVITYLIYG